MTMNESKTMLKDMPWEEAQAIYRAFHTGGFIEFFNTFTGDGWTVKNRDILHPTSVYRIPPQPATIDWSHVSDDVAALAMDKDGRWWTYLHHVPTHGTRVWDERNWNDMLSEVPFSSFKPGNMPWDQSLIVNPNFKGEQND